MYEYTVSVVVHDGEGDCELPLLVSSMRATRTLLRRKMRLDHDIIAAVAVMMTIVVVHAPTHIRTHAHTHDSSRRRPPPLLGPSFPAYYDDDDRRRDQATDRLPHSKTCATHSPTTSLTLASLSHACQQPRHIHTTGGPTRDIIN